MNLNHRAKYKGFYRSRNHYYTIVLLYYIESLQKRITAYILSTTHSNFINVHYINCPMEYYSLQLKYIKSNTKFYPKLENDGAVDFLTSNNYNEMLSRAVVTYLRNSRYRVIITSLAMIATGNWSR